MSISFLINAAGRPPKEQTTTFTTPPTEAECKMIIEKMKQDPDTVTEMEKNRLYHYVQGVLKMKGGISKQLAYDLGKGSPDDVIAYMTSYIYGRKIIEFNPERNESLDAFILSHKEQWKNYEFSHRLPKSTHGEDAPAHSEIGDPTVRVTKVKDEHGNFIGTRIDKTQPGNFGQYVDPETGKIKYKQILIKDYTPRMLSTKITESTDAPLGGGDVEDSLTFGDVIPDAVPAVPEEEDKMDKIATDILEAIKTNIGDNAAKIFDLLYFQLPAGTGTMKQVPLRDDTGAVVYKPKLDPYGNPKIDVRTGKPIELAVMVPWYDPDESKTDYDPMSRLNTIAKDLGMPANEVQKVLLEIQNYLMSEDFKTNFGIDLAKALAKPVAKTEEELEDKTQEESEQEKLENLIKIGLKIENKIKDLEGKVSQTDIDNFIHTEVAAVIEEIKSNPKATAEDIIKAYAKEKLQDSLDAFKEFATMEFEKRQLEQVTPREQAPSADEQ